ncbi:hypothetical protein [Microbacterium sp. NPDC056569]|uniref:hypothetical protein n=1 Tax=Microbacterium sp. NPDC056569 TaxID=3345867 RepID=UPI003672B29F
MPGPVHDDPGAHRPRATGTGTGTGTDDFGPRLRPPAAVVLLVPVFVSLLVQVPGTIALSLWQRVPVRAGFRALLDSEPGIDVVAEASGGQALLLALRGTGGAARRRRPVARRRGSGAGPSTRTQAPRSRPVHARSFSSGHVVTMRSAGTPMRSARSAP